MNRHKQRLEQKPDGKIPEFQFLTEQECLKAIDKDTQLETDADYRLALSKLRGAAKDRFVPLAMAALTKYAAANDDPSRLRPYFATPVDDAIFDRYKMLHTGKVDDLPSPGEPVMGEKGQVDEVFDSYYTIGPGGWSHSGVGLSGSPFSMDNYTDAVKGFKEAHEGHGPISSSDLQPFFKEPVNEALLQKLFQNESASPR